MTFHAEPLHSIEATDGDGRTRDNTPPITSATPISPVTLRGLAPPRVISASFGGIPLGDQRRGAKGAPSRRGWWAAGPVLQPRRAPTPRAGWERQTPAAQGSSPAPPGAPPQGGVA